MKIELHRIPIRELIEGYVDDAESGVRGYGGRLDIRPAYQREFVYKEKERNAVVSTVMKGFPLNVMYWAKNPDGTFEVMDGQQRTISLCQYANVDFAWGELDLAAKYFHRQAEDVRRRFLDYELMVYFCEGTQSEKIDWFKVINIAGLKLTAQEMRNAVYAGPWVADAKRYFSKPGCVAQKIAAYEIQLGVCPRCKGHFEYEEMEGDHIVPWSKGGKTVPENLQMLCRRCNGQKSDK